VEEAGLVHVVDDDPAIRESLKFLLETAGLPTRTYASAAEFLLAAQTLSSGCVLTDVRMPDMDGLTLQKRLVELGSRLPVIVMTGQGDVPIAVQALKEGAIDFLEKPVDDERLITILQQALQASEQARQSAAALGVITTRLNTLTPRERDVFLRLIEGQPNKIIAQDLGTSPRTVEVQRARVMEKMAAKSLPDLVRMALAAQILGPRN